MFPSRIFEGEQHQPFHWSGGSSAGLLIHGFPGTPQELRPLGEWLHRQDWTVRAPLLPGFGSQIDTLPERSYTEWVSAVTGQLAELQERHTPVLLIGYSMGAAVAINAAARTAVDGLILVSPFWQLGEWWHHLIGRTLRPFLRRFRPLARADFSNPDLRKTLANFFPGVDLDDPETRQTLREMNLPISVLENLRRVGAHAYQSAPQIKAPCLILQGVSDEVVLPKRTRSLLQRFSGPVHYEELAAGHELLDPGGPAWDGVRDRILSFFGTVLAGRRR